MHHLFANASWFDILLSRAMTFINVSCIMHKFFTDRLYEDRIACESQGNLKRDASRRYSVEGQERIRLALTMEKVGVEVRKEKDSKGAVELDEQSVCFRAIEVRGVG